MKILAVLLTTLLTSSAFATCEKTAFYFNMPLALGDKIFNDQVEICKKNGQLSGKLTVPKRFVADLQNIKLKGDDLSFSITADEGRGKFTVHYIGKLKENKKYFLGLAKLDGGPVLGPFIAISSKKKITYELIQ